MMHSYASARESRKTARNTFGYRPGQSSLLGANYSGAMATQRFSGSRACEPSDLYLRILDEAHDPSLTLPVTDQAVQSTKYKCLLYNSNAAEAEHLQVALVPQKRSYSTVSPSAHYRQQTKNDFDLPFSLAKRACTQNAFNISFEDSVGVVPTKTMELTQAARAVFEKSSGRCADTANHSSLVRAAMACQKQHFLDQAPQSYRDIGMPDCNGNLRLEVDWEDDPFIDNAAPAVGLVGMPHKGLTAKMSRLSYNASLESRISNGPVSAEDMMNVDKNGKKIYKRMTKPAEAPTKVLTSEEAAKNRRLMRVLMRHEMAREDRTVKHRPSITRNQGIPFVLPLV